jgi:folylpolyglutamate synthase/dihydropteroate synthase
MNFDEAMHWVEAAHVFPPPSELHPQRLAWLLARSGLAARAEGLPWALVAGSCGKASTARLLAFIVRRLLDAAGVDGPVVLGTKPPLSETPDGQRERYQVFARGADAPAWIAPDDFARHAEALYPFEARLAHEAPALGPFAPYDLRYAILLRDAVTRGAAFTLVEANIGLRDDPTAAMPPPVLQLLTPIDTDHAQLLRPPAPLPPELAALGDRAGPVWHKAGGLRPGVTTVVGLQDPPVAHAVAALAAQRHAGPLVWRGPDYDIVRRVCTAAGSDATLRIGDDTLDVHLAAVGDFQVDNAAQAAAAAWRLVHEGVLPGDRATWREAVRDGLAAATMPGRMEVLAARPLTLRQVGASAVKMRGFVKALDDLLPPGAPGRVVVCASFLARIHDALEPVSVLARAPRVAALVATSCATTGDAADLDPTAVLAAARSARPDLPVFAAPDPDVAVSMARALAAGPDDVLVLVGNGLGARPYSAEAASVRSAVTSAASTPVTADSDSAGAATPVKAR